MATPLRLISSASSRVRRARPLRPYQSPGEEKEQEMPAELAQSANGPAPGVTRWAVKRSGSRFRIRSMRTLLPPPILEAFATYKTTRGVIFGRSEEHTSELQSQSNLVCRL